MNSNSFSKVNFDCNPVTPFMSLSILWAILLLTYLFGIDFVHALLNAYIIKYVLLSNSI